MIGLQMYRGREGTPKVEAPVLVRAEFQFCQHGQVARKLCSKKELRVVGHDFVVASWRGGPAEIYEQLPGRWPSETFLRYADRLARKGSLDHVALETLAFERQVQSSRFKAALAAASRAAKFKSRREALESERTRLVSRIEDIDLELYRLDEEEGR